jgi:hypothetical protein
MCNKLVLCLNIYENQNMVRWVWYVACMGEKRNAEGKNLLERLSCRCEDYIKMDLRKIG